MVKTFRRIKHLKKFNILLITGLSTLCLLSTIRFSDTLDSWIVDILSHFPFQYALSAGVLLLICFWKNSIRLALIAGLIFAVNISSIIDSGVLSHAASGNKTIFKVYSANIHRFNNDLSNLLQELEEEKPEIVLLVEVTPEHIHQLNFVINKFPYHVMYTPVGKLDIGIILLSQFPISGVEKKQLTEYGNAAVVSVMDINGRKIKLIGIHAPNPVFKSDFSARKEQFLWIAQKINEESVPAIVAGDFNATPYSPTFVNLLKVAGLKDSRDGFGWQPSWPTWAPFLWIPIDHILVSPEIKVHNRITGSFIGSDHYPVLAELSVS